MTDTKHRVLIVDDEFLIAKLWSIHMEQMGFTVCGIAATAERAIELAVEHRPHLVLMDMRLQGAKDGVDAGMAIHDQVGSKIIYITGSKEPETMRRIALDHPAAVLFKPVSERQLKAAVTDTLGLP